MMTPPRNWHTDGHLYPYSDQDKKDDDVGFFSVFFLTIRCIFSFPFYIIKEIIILIFGNPQDAESSFSLFVFGPIGAGKTTFLEKLGASVNTAGIGTSTEPYSKFETIINDTKISIEKGEDIGGDPKYLKNGKIEKMLKNKDKIVFIFDAKSFLNDGNKAYRGVVMSRLHDLYNATTYRHKIFIIASIDSRSDIIKKDKKHVENEIRKKLIGKSYKDILNQSFGAYNLTSNDDIQTIKNIVFKQ